jgi:hypothetical protein
MKTTSKILILLLAVLAVCPGCKKLLDVKFDAEFVASFPVDLNSNLKNGVPFEESVTIDPLTNSDFNEYSDKINDVNVKSITGEITDLNSGGENIIISNLTITVSKEGFTPIAFPIPGDVEIFEGYTYTYPNDNNLKEVAKIIKNLGIFTVTLSGTSSEAVVSFDYEVTFNTEVTANPLD